MTNKDKYEKFCSEVYVPIFSKPWWMDAVCGSDNWDVFIMEKNVRGGGDILAAMPYFLTIRDKRRIITKAPLAQNNGIIIRYPENQKHGDKLKYEEEIINKACDFIEGLGIDKYEQQYHYSFTNWLPFFWREYAEETRYTYVIGDTSDMSVVESDFDGNTRKNIKKSQRLLHIETDINTETFYEINKLTFDRQDMQIPYSYDFFKNLDGCCKRNQSGKALSAVDEYKNIHSVAYFVWDELSVYYLLSGSDTKYRSSQANTLLIYEGIKFASLSKKKFDFEGSVIKSIEHTFRAYGGIQKPYFRISKNFEQTR